jgi:hypothetical protein
MTFTTMFGDCREQLHFIFPIKSMEECHGFGFLSDTSDCLQ